MVKAPEKSSKKSLIRKKGIVKKTVRRIPRVSKVPMRKVSDEGLARLKRNLQTVWGSYCAPKTKELLSSKQQIQFLAIGTAHVCMNLGFVDKGILMEYELDLGSKAELAGARMYKQDSIMINRYFTTEKGAEELLKTSNTALQTMVDILMERDISEKEIVDAIEKGEQIQLSTE